MSYRKLLGEKYFLTVGLEIHAELNTKSKMFSGSLNDPFNSSPNANIDPVVMAMPGSLPVINKEALRHMVRIGLAVGGEIAGFTEFDRKHYFYPDIPKGYQISQYKYPVVRGGSLAGVEITRVHLEEDTANNKHGGNYSLVDFNRAGVPLMELVTEPVIHSSEKAMEFARELQLLLRYLGASNADMEKGEMRVEVNVSVSRSRDDLGTKVEVKNINSFTFAGKAIDYEVERMIKLYEEGREDEIVQETRGWDANRQITYSQRRKEEAEDYRYFPDPDLPKLYLHRMFDLDVIKSELPELPWEKRKRYVEVLGIKSEDAEMFVRDYELATFFEEAVAYLKDDDGGGVSLLSNYITSDLAGLLAGRSEDDRSVIMDNIKPSNMAELINMVNSGEINSKTAKVLLAKMAEDGVSSAEYAKENNLFQISDEAVLTEIVNGILSENAEKVEAYRNGKDGLFQYFLGMCMKETGGRANPKVLAEVLKSALGGE